MCDYVSSGDTSVEAHALEESLANLMQPAVEDGATGFEEQFRVREWVAVTGCVYSYPANTSFMAEIHGSN